MGLTENSDALLRWLTAGPELARLETQSEFASLERFTSLAATCSKSSVPDWGWVTCSETRPVISSPSSWGWEWRGNVREPVSNTIPEEAKKHVSS